MALVLVDGNSIGYANHNGTKLTCNGMEVQAIFGVIKSIRNLKIAYPNHKLLVLWDGHAQWRYDLHPDYKSNRGKDAASLERREKYRLQRPHIQRALSLLGVSQMTCSSAEADDLAGYTSRQYGEEILLVSGDKDWLQLVNERTSWFDPRFDKKVNHANFFDMTGYLTPQAFLQGKALQGDTSDVIPGVGGIGEKGAPEFLAEFQSVPRFFSLVDEGKFVPKKKAHINLASEEGRAKFTRNMALMNLLNVPTPKREDITASKTTLDVDGFRDLCNEFAFVSLISKLDEFVRPYQ